MASSKQTVREYTLNNDVILKNVTQFNAVFSEFNLREAVVFAGAGILSVDEIEARYKALMAGDEIRQVSKRLVNKQTGKASVVIAYTTQELIAIEKEMLAMAKALKSSDGHKIDIEIVNQKQAEFTAKTGFILSEDQCKALHAATTGSDIAIIEGYAGSGKTAGIVVAKDALESAGYNVMGCAPSGKAAEGLEAAGIESVTIAKLLLQNMAWTDDDGKWHPAKRPLSGSDVIVVDECGMVGSRDWHALSVAAKNAGAKLIFMGDRSQLQAVSAGGAMSAVVQAIGGVDATLKTVHRQKQGTDIAKAVAFARQAEIHKSLDILDELGCLALVEDREEGLEAVTSAWKKHYDHGSTKAEQTSIMLANTNTDAERLNTIARLYLKASGMLHGENSTLLDVTDKWGSFMGQKEFCQNERIIFLKNAKLGKEDQLRNGNTGRILSIEDKMLTVQLEGSNKVICFSTDDYSRFSHAYAITTHKSQGISVDHAAILAGGGMQSLNQIYVQLSRVRHSADLVLPKKDIELQMANAQPTQNMLDFAYHTAQRCGHNADLIDTMSFLDCRNYLNDNTMWEIKGRSESDVERWRREIGGLITQMSTLEVKETSLDYELVHKKPGVAEVYAFGELARATPDMNSQAYQRTTAAVIKHNEKPEPTVKDITAKAHAYKRPYVAPIIVAVEPDALLMG